jgi:hypothetical protein
MDKVYRLLMESPCFKGVEITPNGITIPTGCVYSDQTDLTFSISQRNDKIIISDDGRTRAYMNTIFELTSSDVIKHILAVTGYYGINTKDRELSLEIDAICITEALLKLIYCIGFLDAMKVLYISKEAN